MKSQTDRRRGSALTELSVVLAITAVVFVIVVSIVVVMSGRLGDSGSELRAIEELELIESVAEEWLTSMTEAGAEITPASDKARLCAVVDGDTYYFGFADGTLSGTYLHGNTVSYAADVALRIEFAVMQNSRGKMYICSVACDDMIDDVFVFTVCPRAGRQYTASDDGEV